MISKAGAADHFKRKGFKVVLYLESHGGASMADAGRIPYFASLELRKMPSSMRFQRILFSCHKCHEPPDPLVVWALYGGSGGGVPLVDKAVHFEGGMVLPNIFSIDLALQSRCSHNIFKIK